MQVRALALCFTIFVKQSSFLPSLCTAESSLQSMKKLRTRALDLSFRFCLRLRYFGYVRLQLLRDRCQGDRDGESLVHLFGGRRGIMILPKRSISASGCGEAQKYKFLDLVFEKILGYYMYYNASVLVH